MILAEFVSHIALTVKAILQGMITSFHTDKKHTECPTVVLHTLNKQESTGSTQNLTMNLNSQQFYRNTITAIMNRSITIFSTYFSVQCFIGKGQKEDKFRLQTFVHQFVAIKQKTQTTKIIG